MVSTSWTVFISRCICTIHCFGNLICLAYLTTEMRKVSTKQHIKNDHILRRSPRHENQLRYTLIKNIQKWTVNIHSYSKNMKVRKEWEHSLACERWNNSNFLHIWKYLPNSQREFETSFHKLHSRDPRKDERQDRMTVLHKAVPPPPLSLLSACPSSLQYGGRIAQTKAVKIRQTIRSLHKKTQHPEMAN